MTNVKRYGPALEVRGGGHEASMRVTPDGDYYHEADYAKLQAKYDVVLPDMVKLQIAHDKLQADVDTCKTIGTRKQDAIERLHLEEAMTEQAGVVLSKVIDTTGDESIYVLALCVVSAMEALNGVVETQSKNAKRLQAIVDKLPTLGCGTPLVPGMEVWYQLLGQPLRAYSVAYHFEDDDELRLHYESSGGSGFFPAERLKCYSTKQAAEQAQGGE